MTMSDFGNWRNPTEEELEAIADWYKEHYDETHAEAYTSGQLAIGVIDDYQTGSPGYCGRLAFVVGECPNVTIGFRWNEEGEVEDFEFQ